MLVNLKNKNFEPDTVNRTFLVNANEDYSINWIDTLDTYTGYSYNSFPPLYYGNDVFFIFNDTLYSYDYNSGIVNWTTEVNGNDFSKVVIVEGEFYVIISDFRFAKFNPDTGEIIWTNPFGRAPSVIGDFELYQNKIVYSQGGFGSLTVLNNLTGEIEMVDNSFDTNISNPKLYRKEGIFIAHSVNEIIAFEIIE